ncbi:hypothetical protein [Paenibacillus sp. IHBB 10380]|uniref:hypothetical protein n=1 Tax=Paenibacillus sp. IHBB 10380 TaxID=1566358 RepID=UPI0005CFD995|nr:hypothetical protein [Paenibacillus sp. IHBB 10380]AJS57197.1 hypothetical protein UB51_00280 [Paenibacillus sp. IHBB 10380]
MDVYTRYRAAILEIKNGNSDIGFQLLLKLCNDEDAGNIVVNMLIKDFYEPSLKMMKNRYELNRNLFLEYPYFFPKDVPVYEELSFYAFKVDEKKSCLFDKSTFTHRWIETNSERETAYFFSEIKEPLLVENETNEFNFRFLMDNVRMSEDVAIDNHIYMYYENPDLFYALMQLIDFSALVKNHQFVFLLGQEERLKYPIDFKEVFGIDYSSMTPVPVRLEELKRLCIWANRPYSGTALSLDALGNNSQVEYAFESDFHILSTINDRLITQDPTFVKILFKVHKTYTLDQIKSFVNQQEVSIKLADLEELFSQAESHFKDKQHFNVIEIFKAIFLLRYLRKKKNPRIVPLILFEPHLLNFHKAYSHIMEQFQYLTVLTCVRDPIRAFLSGYERKNLVTERLLKFVLNSEYGYSDMVDSKYCNHYFAFRFEDLKLYPSQMLMAACELLNIPFEKEMLLVETPTVDSEGKLITGFDLTPLTRDFSDMISEFDNIRLKIFYGRIYKHYGYESFDLQEYVLKDELVMELFEIPFRFEKYHQNLYGHLPDVPNAVTLRSWIFDTLRSGYLKSKYDEVLFPRLLSPAEKKH